MTYTVLNVNGMASICIGLTSLPPAPQPPRPGVWDHVKELLNVS
jgi:hypothetical protein